MLKRLTDQDGALVRGRAGLELRAFDLQPSGLSILFQQPLIKAH